MPGLVPLVPLPLCLCSCPCACVCQGVPIPPHRDMGLAPSLPTQTLPTSTLPTLTLPTSTRRTARPLAPLAPLQQNIKKQPLQQSIDATPHTPHPCTPLHTPAHPSPVHTRPKHPQASTWSGTTVTCCAWRGLTGRASRRVWMWGGWVWISVDGCGWVWMWVKDDAALLLKTWQAVECRGRPWRILLCLLPPSPPSVSGRAWTASV